MKRRVLAVLSAAGPALCLLALLSLTSLACGGGPEPSEPAAPSAPPAAESKAEEPVVTEDGELIFREDFESGELPETVIQGDEEEP